MKKIIAIWLGVIVILLVGGIVIGKFTMKPEEEKPPITEYEYTDESGNIIREPIDDGTVTVEDGSGNKYTYNPLIWVGKNITIDGCTVKAGSVSGDEPLTLDMLKEAGIEPESYNNATLITKAGTSFDADYNVKKGIVRQIEIRNKTYNDIMRYATAPYCEEVILPGNIKMGYSTFEDIKKVYGEAEQRPLNDNMFSMTYYQTEEKKVQQLELIFDNETQTFIGLNWRFSY